MIVDRRRIEHLSLRVRRKAEVREAKRTIEEALRRASLPGDGRPGRLFIRRLELPPLHLSKGPGPITSWLEHRIRESWGRAIPITDPRAATADVVIARDPIEPLVVALTEAAAGHRLTQWFWPQIHHALGAPRPVSRAAAQIWTMLAEREDRIVAVPAVVGVVLDGASAPARRAAFAAIDLGVGRALARALGEPQIRGAAQTAALQAVIPRRWHSTIRQALEDWGDEERAAWLITAAVRAARPRISALAITRLGSSERPHDSSTEFVVGAEGPRGDESTEVQRRAGVERAAPTPRRAVSEATIAQRLAEPPPPPSRAEGEAPDPARSAAVDPASPLRDRTASDSTVELITKPGPLAPATHGDPSPAKSDPPTGTVPEPAAATAPSRPWSEHWSLIDRPRPTRYGGLYFLLRALARLGIGAFLEDHPQLADVDLAVRLLDHIARAMQIPPDDPIRLPLRLPPLTADVDVPAPPQWRELWTAAHPRPRLCGQDRLEDLLDTWHAAVGAWLDRFTEVDLVTVVHRDGAVTCSRTHLDVIFDMELSDLAIRKAALDLNPGWVPWFGRVVQFHYVFGGMLDA